MQVSNTHKRQALLNYELSHNALKTILNSKTKDQTNDWCKYLKTATSIHNTHCHLSIDWSPNVLFYELEPIKPLLLRFKSILIELFFQITIMFFHYKTTGSERFLKGNLNRLKCTNAAVPSTIAKPKPSFLIFFQFVFSVFCYILN